MGLKKKKAIFLDRDGVINVDSGYIWRIEDFVFYEGVFEACRYARELGYVLIVVTNQAGIGRGIFSESDYQNLTSWMCRRFADHDIELAGVFHAPTHPQEGIGIYKRESIDRKPGPGMILKASKTMGIDLEKSAMVGDRETDIEAAINAGVGKKILINLGLSANSTKADVILPSLLEAIDWLSKNN
ncbi:MAG: D-glycero-alpha-D-manno-heptose-1,7-bisphosphate 7-phosphatase [Alphaproteobacteria bacterium]